jgi:hypothetical protein
MSRCFCASGLNLRCGTRAKEEQDAAEEEGQRCKVVTHVDGELL